MPLGIWKYADFEPMEAEGIKNDCQQEITKYCGVFKTLGDRRLQTNLIQGLFRLIKAVVNQSRAELTSAENVEAVYELFSAKGRYDAEQGKI